MDSRTFKKPQPSPRMNILALPVEILERFPLQAPLLLPMLSQTCPSLYHSMDSDRLWIKAFQGHFPHATLSTKQDVIRLGYEDFMGNGYRYRLKQFGAEASNVKNLTVDGCVVSPSEYFISVHQNGNGGTRKVK